MKTPSKSLVGLILSLIAMAAASRLIPHPPNFTAVVGTSLLAGAYFSNRKAFAIGIPVIAMLLSDLVLGAHSLQPFTVGFMALLAWIATGTLAIEKTSGNTLNGKLLGVTVSSSVAFFILSNLGVWAIDGFYPRTLEGLVACYVAAIPFFGNSLLGDLFYTGALFFVAQKASVAIYRRQALHLGQ